MTVSVGLDRRCLFTDSQHGVVVGVSNEDPGDPDLKPHSDMEACGVIWGCSHTLSLTGLL